MHQSQRRLVESRRIDKVWTVGQSQQSRRCPGAGIIHRICLATASLVCWIAIYLDELGEVAGQHRRGRHNDRRQGWRLVAFRALVTTEEKQFVLQGRPAERSAELIAALRSFRRGEILTRSQ